MAWCGRYHSRPSDKKIRSPETICGHRSCSLTLPSADRRRRAVGPWRPHQVNRWQRKNRACAKSSKRRWRAASTTEEKRTPSGGVTVPQKRRSDTRQIKIQQKRQPSSHPTKDDEKLSPFWFYRLQAIAPRLHREGHREEGTSTGGPRSTGSDGIPPCGFPGFAAGQQAASGRPLPICNSPRYRVFRWLRPVSPSR